MSELPAETVPALPREGRAIAAHTPASVVLAGAHQAARRRRRIRRLAGLALLAAAGLAAFFWFLPADEAAGQGAWIEVTRRPFRAERREMGTVVAKNETQVFSQYTGEIVWKIEEGSVVKPGDVLVRFDATGTRDDLEKMKQDLFEKEDAVARAKEEVESTERRYELEIARLEAALAKAQVERDRVHHMPDEDEKTQAALNLQSAELKFKQSQKEYEAYAKLHEHGFVTEAVLKQKALKRATDKAEFEKEKVLHHLVLQGATEDSRRLASLAVADAEKNLSTAKFNRDADLSIKRADLELNEIFLENFRQDLARKAQELDDSEVRALVPGRVAFVDVWKGSGALSPIQVGEMRNRGQDLCKIVDTTLLRVKIWVNEADVAKFAPGQDAQVHLPAFPGRTYKAKVSEVAPVAEDKNVALSSLALRRAGEAFVNVVAVTLDFADLSEADRRAMRLGFTAEGVVDCTPEDWRGKEGVLVPWGAIQREGEKRFVTAREGGRGRGRRIEVELGRSDAFHVEIASGLNGGEEVFDRTAHALPPEPNPGTASPDAPKKEARLP